MDTPAAAAAATPSEERPWSLVRSRVELYPDGTLRAVTGRPVGRVRLCGVDCEVRRASYVDQAILEERLGGRLHDLLRAGLTSVQHVAIARIACTPIDPGQSLPENPSAWPFADHYLIADVVSLFLGQGELVLRA